MACHLGAEESELRRIDPQSGEVLESLKMPAGVGVSGLSTQRHAVLKMYGDVQRMYAMVAAVYS